MNSKNRYDIFIEESLEFWEKVPTNLGKEMCVQFCILKELQAIKHTLYVLADQKQLVLENQTDKTVS